MKNNMFLDNTLPYKAVSYTHLDVYKRQSLSMQIKSLEEELGVVLLDRSKKPVIPTEAGAVVLERARETLKAYNCIREAVAELKGETAGKLRLGVIPTIAPYLLHKFIPTFVREYPKVELEISEMITSEIVEALKMCIRDSLLTARPPQFEGGIPAQPVDFAVRQDEELLVGRRVDVEPVSLVEQGRFQLQGRRDGLTGDPQIEPVGEERLELDAGQAAFGQQGADVYKR